MNDHDSSSGQHGFQVAGDSAASYEAYLVPVLHQPWAAELVDLVAPEAGDSVLDLACGTGIVARLVAPRVGDQGRVVGVDLNPGMLAMAARLAPDESITWEQGSATDLPVPDQDFDSVICQQGFQFFADRSAAAREMHRVLRPGGRVAVSVWRSEGLHPVWKALDEALEKQLGDDPGQTPFPEWSAEELRTVFSEAGFDEVGVRIGVAAARFPEPDEFLRQIVVSSPLAEPVGDLDSQAQHSLLDDFRSRVADHVDDEGVVFAMQTYLIHAHR